MRARKAKAAEPPYDEHHDKAVPPNKLRKARAPRVRLTHLEIRRGHSLRLRIAIADDALAEVGDELGALIKRVAPGTQIAVIAAPEADLVISRAHEGDEATYHANLRIHLAELFSSLCDTSLSDALEIVRDERARRAEGGN